ncbi:MAG: hypothetical protein EB084_24445, partial [Proteobacteria bacterium]|nr:hypothetical protein [Pseudomonadota bacterium]
MDERSDSQNGELEYTRAPTQEDLKQLCAWLNAEGARYVVIGGMAVNHYGVVRATMDIDLMVDPHRENMERVIRALSNLPDRAALALEPEEIEHYVVLRVNDVFTVDLLAKACDVTFDDVTIEVDHRLGVAVPFASPADIIRKRLTNPILSRPAPCDTMATSSSSRRSRGRWSPA